MRFILAGVTYSLIEIRKRCGSSPTRIMDDGTVDTRDFAQLPLGVEYHTTLRPGTKSVVIVRTA